ncbi:MAG TPA: hypothetical protein VFT34_15060 [Verrucomicrobiae bacterium]|nr:hypothetical protein [Verrucomicrobiae bacterium]
MKLPLLLQIAGLLHLGLLCAGALMPRTVKLREHLATLPSFIRRLFFVYFAFIALLLASFGLITFFFADALAAGTPLAKALCLFLLVFWTARLGVAAFVFDVGPYLTNQFYRVGYQATNVAFVYLVAVYGLAVWKGGAL